MAQQNKSNAGRKWFDGRDEKEVVSKLEEAFSIGCTTVEACLYADISRKTFYEYIKHVDDGKPEGERLSDRFEELKDRPVLKARATVVASLHNPHDAQWFLERKRKSEFSTRAELTGAEGKSLNSGLALDDPEIEEIKERAEKELEALYKSRIKKSNK